MDNWQTPFALAIVAVALFAILRGAFTKKKKFGCGGGFCSFPKDRFKAALKRSQDSSPPSA